MYELKFNFNILTHQPLALDTTLLRQWPELQDEASMCVCLIFVAVFAGLGFSRRSQRFQQRLSLLAIRSIGERRFSDPKED